MSDRIAVRGIRAYGRHGVFALEQTLRQPFDIDIDLDADLAAARAGDDLDDTLDYAALHAVVTRLVETSSYRLLERLADEIGAYLIRDPRVLRARVTIAKPRLLSGATPSVTIETVRSTR